MEKETNKTFDTNVSDLLIHLFKRIWISILVAAVFFGAAYWYSANKIPRMYTSRSQLFIISNNASYSSQHIAIDDNFTRNYAYLIKNNSTILGNVIESNDLDLTISQLSAKIKVSCPEDTQLINIAVTDANPMMAKNLSYSICVEAKKYISEQLIKTDNIIITEEGNLPTKHSSPNIKNNALTAAVISFILVNLIFSIFYFFNDTVTKPEEIEKQLGLLVIGKIPHSNQLTSKNISLTDKNK